MRRHPAENEKVPEGKEELGQEQEECDLAFKSSMGRGLADHNKKRMENPRGGFPFLRGKVGDLRTDRRGPRKKKLRTSLPLFLTARRLSARKAAASP